MANSVRQQILDRMVTALGAITVRGGYHTDVKKVFTDIEALEEIPKSKVPCLFVLGGDEMRAPMTWGGTVARSLFSVLVGGVVFSVTGVIDTAIEDLILDSNKAVLNDATLGALVLWIEAGSVVRHNDSGPNFGSFDQVYKVHYIYQSATGG